MAPTTVLFDLDGVLIDSHAAFTASVNHALVEYGLPERVPEMLAAVGARHRLVIATSKAASLAEKIVRALGLEPYFAALYGPADETSAEPKAQTVARALPAIALVGDTRCDVEAALANDVRAIAVTWGIGAPDDLLAAGADAVVHTPSELDALL